MNKAECWSEKNNTYTTDVLFVHLAFPNNTEKEVAKN